MCPLSKRPLSNVHPAAVLRPSGMVVSTQCVKDCIKKDMIDPFTEPPASCALGRPALPSPALPPRPPPCLAAMRALCPSVMPGRGLNP